jgi:hypothetical protein
MDSQLPKVPVSLQTYLGYCYIVDILLTYMFHYTFHIDSLWDYFIAFRRLAPVTSYMLTHNDREYEELQLKLCSLRMFLVKCGMIATQVQNLGLCVEGVCETRAHFPQSVDTATFPLRFRLAQVKWCVHFVTRSLRSRYLRMVAEQG